MEAQTPFEALFRKYVDGNATEAETMQFLSLVDNLDDLEELQRLVDLEMETDLADENLSPFEKEEILTNIFQFTATRKIFPSRWVRIAVAASVLLFISVGIYFLLGQNQIQHQSARNQVNDILPGSNKAILTLSNGKQVVLNSAQNGTIANQNEITINKTEDGKVVYQSGAQGMSKTRELVFNTMTTPRGGQYQLRLADGTQVWLNAASSIKYPTAFLGNERKVEVTGEVYFEVSHDASKPFKVVSNEQTVEVLGTHFNINAYADEKNIKTTLLQGSVRIVARGNKAILKVGQASEVNQNKISISSADDTAVAWKDGYFEFSESDIQTVMRQLSRWYNVDVTYTGAMPQETFTTRISRNKNISQVLNIIRASKSVHVEIQGRRIMVKN